MHGDPFDAGAGAHARRHEPLFDRQGQDPSLYGLLDLLEFHGAPRNRGCQSRSRSSLRQHLLHRLRRYHGDRRGHQYGASRGRRDGHRVRFRRHRPQCHSRSAARRRRHDYRRRFERRQEKMGRAFRHDAFRQSEGNRRRYRCSSGQHDQARRRSDRWRRLHIRLHRQREGDAPGAGSGAGVNRSSSVSLARARKSRHARSSS